MKLSIVTPSSNSARFISETILSVISQSGNFKIEYLILDNCSNDGTKEIVEGYQDSLRNGTFPVKCRSVDIQFISQKDNSMYDAINKGFARSTGDIFSWLNSDDIYLQGAFATIVKTFEQFSDIQWVKGITSYITADSVMWKEGICWPYSQEWIKNGVYGKELYFIQQDSVFWRSDLWNKVQKIDTSYKRAGDYYLWLKFAEFSELVSIKSCLSCFRKVEGQLSQDLITYMDEVERISPRPNKLSYKLKIYSKAQRLLPKYIAHWLHRYFFGKKLFSLIQLNESGELIRSREECFNFSQEFYER